MKSGENKQFFEFGGGFTYYMGQLFDLFLAGLLWFLCSLPLITAGAASAALYRSVVTCIKKKEGYLVRVFFTTFRKTFFSETIVFVLLLGASKLITGNIAFLLDIEQHNILLFFICLYAFVLSFFPAFFIYTSVISGAFYENTTQILKKSLYLMIKYLPITLAVSAVLLCFSSFVYRFPILIFVVPGPCAFVVAEFMERVLSKC